MHNRPASESGVPRRVLGQHLRDLRYRAGLTVKVPERVSLEHAAGFPIAFVTAHLALRHVARLDEINGGVLS